ncbi:hypothetical protein ACFYYH_06505 [Streptomyces sp. NPDC002018]|uniref:hypothetical protein n=1 Tax=Streptomyces sp. NPDC002018 TaxID=3364629 RepID=UPI00367C50A9
MADKTIAQLDAEVQEMRENLGRKADAQKIKDVAFEADPEAIATESWVKKETASSLWETVKDPEFLGLVTALTVVKLELAPLLSLEPAIDAFLKRYDVERNRFGFMWRVAAEERQRRAREIADARARLERMEKGIARLQDLTTGAHSKIRNSHTRIQALERRVSRMDTRSNVARQQIRHMDSSPDLSGTTSQVTLLERRVNLLAAALS